MNETGKKRIDLWLFITATARPVMWEEMPEHVKQERGLQQQGGGYSPPATRSA